MNINKINALRSQCAVLQQNGQIPELKYVPKIVCHIQLSTSIRRKVIRAFQTGQVDTKRSRNPRFNYFFVVKHWNLIAALGLEAGK